MYIAFIVIAVLIGIIIEVLSGEWVFSVLVPSFLLLFSCLIYSEEVAIDERKAEYIQIVKENPQHKNLYVVIDSDDRVDKDELRAIKTIIKLEKED